MTFYLLTTDLQCCTVVTYLPRDKNARRDANSRQAALAETSSVNLSVWTRTKNT